MISCMQSFHPPKLSLLQPPPNHHPCSHSTTTLRKSGKSNAEKELRLILQSCSGTKSLEKGVELLSQIPNLKGDVALTQKLLAFYCACGRFDGARQLFDETPEKAKMFLLPSMISQYIEHGFPEKAVWLFREMLESGVRPTAYTFSMLLRASTYLGSRRLAEQFHSMVIKRSSLYSLTVTAPLIRVYGSFEDFASAYRIFEQLHDTDIASWTAIIHTCSHLVEHAQSFELFSRMQFDYGLKPNELTVVSVLPACGYFSSLRRGQAIHAYVIRNGFSSNVIVGCALVSMYARCGNPVYAFRVFGSFDKRRDVVLWTSMIEAYSMNGRFKSAFELFQLMQDACVKPNDVTMVVILSACSHSGLANEGWEIFMSMKEKFGVEPEVKHYACLVDMLGRAGRLDEAESLIRSMRLRPSCSIFGSLLGACLVHRNVKLGEKVAYKLFELEPKNVANYVMLSNIYAAVGRWGDVGRLKDLMEVKGFSRDHGHSWIEIQNKVFVFGAHDRSNPESKSIYEFLKELQDQIIKAGYVPSTKFVLHQVEEDDKRKLLCTHSERLAIAFGMMKLPPGLPFRIAKNLRVCGDCHEAIKLVSKVTRRDLIIRDTVRFHHFSHGSCSCRDYW